jgi:hypothetical protein
MLILIDLAQSILFNDFIGDYSSFNEPFDNLDKTGWTYSYNKPSDIELLN